MPAHIVIAHDDVQFARAVAFALRLEDYDVATISDPMEALVALEQPKTIELLITRPGFHQPGKPNAIAIARMLRLKRPKLTILFIDDGEQPELVEGLGILIPSETTIGEILLLVQRQLDPPSES